MGSSDETQAIRDRFGALSTMRLNRRSFVRFSALTAGAVVSIPLLAACGGDEDEEADTPDTTNTTGVSAAPTGTTAAVDEATATTATGAASPTTGSASPTTGDGSPTTATGSGSSGEMIDGGDRLMGKTIEPPESTGGTLIEASILDLRTLNPLLMNDNPSFNVGFMVFENLAEANPDTLDPVGNLAEGWETTEDAKTWTVYLREGVTWHDGEAFDAEDVKLTYDLYMNPDSGSNQTSDLAGKVESVEIIDPMTVQFNLKLSIVDFLLDIAGGTYLIIPEHIWGAVPPSEIQQHPGATGTDPSQVVGTGPFIFQEWITGDRVTVTKNPNYWDGDVVLDEVIYKIVPDTSAAVAQLRTGEVDIFVGVQGAQVADLESADVVITDYPTLSFNFYGTQLDETKSTKFQDARVRQALLYAIDRQAIVDEIFFGYSQVAVGTIPTLSWAFNPEGIDPALLYEYDPELSVQLLDEAGWVEGSDGIREKDGEKMSFLMYGISSSETAVQTLQVMQESWREIGVEMTPTPEPFQSLVSRVTETFDFEAFIVGFGWGATPDQGAMWKCDSYGSGFNIVKYCNPEVDAALDAALSELDRDTRIELYADFQNLLLADLPMAVTDFPKGIAAVSTRVHNHYANTSNVRFNMETWWVEQ
ncbi:MAG: ABC transporter substrate-binding protein [Chloroflexota bacterium]|nr:ABC transporter substrate-binding protein [Chloroflexota bacterium]